MATWCPQCGGSNPVGAKFCSSCGTALASTCSRCGAQVVEGARFCIACGERLETSEAAPEETGIEPSSEERKVVTVVFCDLAGFTAHTARTDPEDVRARLTAFHTAVRQDVERFGGHVEKLMGDGVFSVFGAPVAHEDDPERAVQAALRILDSVEDLNARDGFDLTVKVAVTTGEAIVQTEDTPDREGIVGDVVNTASRLESLAAHGTVVVDERTHRATRHTIEYTELDPVTVKGKVDSLPVWRADASKSRFGVAIDDSPETPFVGRAEELSLLVDAFERTLARSAPQLATIIGEPGVGKTRLVREFRQLVDDRDELVFWRQGRCVPYGEGVSFWAISEIVKAHAGILESETPEVAISKLDEAVGTLVSDSDQAEWIASRLRPLIGVDRSTDEVARPELFAAWTRFFEALAARNPLVMVIEDLHWADDPVIDFIDHLTEWAAESPILLVATARPELFADRPEWGAGRRDAVTVGLAPLADEEAAELMAAVANQPVMPVDLQQRLLSHAGGNPLYVTEYARLSREEGWFERPDGATDLPLPDSIQSIISARIDLLSPEDKNLLATAAVVGRVFWTAALTFADAGTHAAVREGLRRLTRREMIRPVRRSSMQDQEEYTFAHILTRDVAYSRLTRDERARLHAATARWLEAVNGDRAGDVAELIAHHLATAYELAGTDDPGLRKRAYRFLMLAEERAAILDSRAAVDLARRAVRFASDDRERGQALMEAASHSYRTDDETLDMHREAVEAFRAAGDTDGLIRAMVRMSNTYWVMGKAETVDAIDSEVLELAEGRPPSGEVVEAMVAVASKLQLRGNEAAALDLLDRALPLAQEIGDTRIFSRALGIRGTALAQLSDMDGLADLEEGLRIQLDLGDAPLAIATYNNLATLLNDLGESRRAETAIREARSLAERRGLVAHHDWSSLTLSEILFPLGEWDEVVAIADRLLVEERVQRTQVANGLSAFRAAVDYYRGRPRRAWEVIPSSIAGARQSRDPQGLIPSLARNIAIAAAVGEDATARGLVTELVEASADHPLFLALHLPWAARPIADLGMLDELAVLTSRCDRRYEWLSHQNRLCDAVLAMASGRSSEALETLTVLIGEADRRDQVVLGLLARQEAARAASADGDIATVKRMLDEAQRVADTLGAVLVTDSITEIRAGATSATQ